MFIKKIKAKEVEKKSLIEKVVPVFIVYLIIITVFYAFYTILYSCGIVKPEPIEREWINYNISLITPILIVIGVIHLVSLFLSKKVALGAIASALLSGLCGIWFLYHVKAWGGRLSSIKVENIEIAFYFISFAVLGFVLFIASLYTYLEIRKIKPVLWKLLMIILAFFVITFLIISKYISIQKLTRSSKIELQYQASLFRGKYAAMRDLKNGNAAILVYGLMSSRYRFDKKTGLKLRAIAGCIVSPSIEGYTESYNNYIHESIVKFGLPKNSKRKYSNIILYPADYMYSNLDGTFILLQKDTVAYSPDGNYSVLFPSASKYGRLISNGKKNYFHFSYSKKSSIEIKWGPKGSGILFLRVNPQKKPIKYRSDYILIYVIDLNDGSVFNVVRDKFDPDYLFRNIHTLEELKKYKKSMNIR